jgi:predicted CopG family antitoxin
VDPGSHGALSMLALLADYDPSPLWHAHLRFNGINLHYRNPTSEDRKYDLAELWVRCGRETATAVVPEESGVYLKLGKFQRAERQQDRHLESYGLAGTAFGGCALPDSSRLDLRLDTVHAPTMDTKTIELDAEAYEALARQKRPGQTFSEVIKSHFGRRATASDLRQLAAELKISEDTLDAIEDQIRARSESPATAAEL